MTLTCFIRYQIDPFQRGAFRTRLKADPDGHRNFAFAQGKRFILREERSFLENVESP